jgi:hypothetical protein
MAGANAVQRFVVMEEAVRGTAATLAVRMLSDGVRFRFGMCTMCSMCVQIDGRAIELEPPGRALEATPKMAWMERVLEHMNTITKEVLREIDTMQNEAHGVWWVVDDPLLRQPTGQGTESVRAFPQHDAARNIK